MRIRTLIAAAGCGAALTVAAVAGQASAVTPVALPDQGVVGVGFNHSETVALSQTPLPAILGSGILAPITDVHVDDQSSIPRGDGKIFADLPTVVRDAADAPNGKLIIALADPGRYHGKVLLIGTRY